MLDKGSEWSFVYTVQGGRYPSPSIQFKTQLSGTVTQRVLVLIEYFYRPDGECCFQFTKIIMHGLISSDGNETGTLTTK